MPATGSPKSLRHCWIKVEHRRVRRVPFDVVGPLRGGPTSRNGIAMIVDCPDFLDRYSDFRDDCLDAESRSAFEGHIRSCASCARYDRVVSNGVQLFASAPEIEPSEDFYPRLQHRIFHLEDARGLSNRRASGASLAALGIAAAVAFAAWTPSLNSGDTLQAPVVLASESAAYTHWFGGAAVQPIHSVAIHGPLAPALEGSGAELLLWSPVGSMDPTFASLTSARAGIP